MPSSALAALAALAALTLARGLTAQSADTTLTTAESADAAPSGELAKLPAARRYRDAMIDSRDFSTALKPATEAVSMQEKTRDANYWDDLTTLARVQAELGQLDKAEMSYLAAIAAVEAAGGEFSLDLLSPYRGLARSYIRGGRYPEAITTLQTAREVSQRNLGLFNVEQSPLLDDLTTAYLGLGDTREAQRLQIELVDNAIKRYGETDQRVIPFRYHLADYYERSRLPDSAREQYTAVLKTQESLLGPSHPALLAPLRELVHLDLLTDQTAHPEAHARLVSVLEQNPDTDPVERGLALATLGDWAIVAGDTDAARAYYQQAWAALSKKTDFDVAGVFAKPEMIDFVAPLNSVDRGEKRKPYAWAEIEFQLDVAADGSPSNVHVVHHEGAQRLPQESVYSRRVRETHFRPRVVAGEPVATDDVKFTHYFRVYVDDKKKKSADVPNTG
ncbi:MAG TPA: tetratricopeptide repeat protein [Gammaproteobacteria bacterium]|nr:tetratricopeptide repeat protein [Gammaproteobacteria bacterium]